jgi:hypothetical protein
MFASYEHPPVSPALSSCDMESIDEMPSPPVTAQHSINDDLTINTTALQNSISLRFKVSLMVKRIDSSKFESTFEQTSHSTEGSQQNILSGGFTRLLNRIVIEFQLLMNTNILVFKILRQTSTLCFFFAFKKKRKRKLESDTVSLRSLEEFVGDHFQRKKRLSLPRLSSVSELLSPMCDRVINMLQTTKQSSSANLLNLLNTNNSTTHNYNIRRKGASSNSVSSPNTVKKFRAAWSETCDGEKLKQTMTATEIERQNVLYELFSEEQQMIENLGLAQRVIEISIFNRMNNIFLGLSKWYENIKHSFGFRIKTNLWTIGRYFTIT